MAKQIPEFWGFQWQTLAEIQLRVFLLRMLLISQYRAFGILLRIVAEILSENLVTGASGCGTPRKDVSVKAGEVEDGSQ